MTEGKRECRCGALIDADVQTMIAHVTSELHEARLRDAGFLSHNHSWRWVDAAGHPVDGPSLDATAYRHPGCPACEAGE